MSIRTQVDSPVASVAFWTTEVPALAAEPSSPPVAILSLTLSSCSERSACWVRSPASSCASFLPSGESG